MQYSQLPHSIVHRADMRRLGVIKRVLQAQEETAFPAQLDGLHDGAASEIVLHVADPVFQAPVCSLGVIGSDGLVQRSAVVGIVFEDYFPVSEVLCERYVVGAQLIEEWFAAEFEVEIDHRQHCQQRHDVVVLGEFLNRVDDFIALPFTLARLHTCRLFFHQLALLVIRLGQQHGLHLLLLLPVEAQALHAHLQLFKIQNPLS